MSEGEPGRDAGASGVSRDEEGKHFRWESSPRYTCWRGLQSLSNPYRNALIHQRPLFVQANLLPTKDGIDRLSGLTAISKLALRDRSVADHALPAHQVVHAIVDSAAGLCNEFWRWAARALDGLEGHRNLHTVDVSSTRVADLGPLAGKPIRLRLILVDGDLYSFRFRKR